MGGKNKKAQSRDLDVDHGDGLLGGLEFGWDLVFLVVLGLVIWSLAVAYVRDWYAQFEPGEDPELVLDVSAAAAIENIEDGGGSMADLPEVVAVTPSPPAAHLSQFRSLPFDLASAQASVAQAIRDLESEWKIFDPPTARVSLFQRGLPAVGTEWMLARRLSRKLLLGEPLVLGVTGSSNSAGHDNELADAYPSVLQAQLASVLEPLGVAVLLRNAGVGNTKTLPACLCLPAMLSRNPDVFPSDRVGAGGGESSPNDTVAAAAANRPPAQPLAPDHVDVVLWEWLMNDAGTFPENTVWYETFIRSAVRDLRAASVLFVHIESGREKEQRDRDPVRQPAELNLHFSEPPFRTLRQAYADYVNCNDLFTRDALWPLDDVAPFRLEDLFGALHPLPSGHRFIAHLLLHYMLEALELALADLGTLGAKGRATLAGLVEVDEAGGAPASQVAGLPLSLLPEQPVACERIVCGARPHCATSISPHGAGPNISLADAVISWGGDGGGGGRDTKNDDSGKSDGGKWEWTLLEGEHLHPERHYLDRKDVLRGNVGSGWLVLNATVRQKPAGLIVLCEPATEWVRPEGVGPLAENIELSLNGEPWPLPARSDQLAFSRGQVFHEHCLEVGHDHLPGVYKLGIRVKPSPGAPPSTHVYLSHLITV